MRAIALSILVAVGLLAPTLVGACLQSAVQDEFDRVAPDASDLIAVQVESLSLEKDSEEVRAGDGHAFRGKIRVLKRFRGSGQFDAIRYINTRCYGLRLDVGGIYLIATNSAGSLIELESYSAPI
ncbi:MAG: hypothetical protein ACJ8MR_11760, partial [Povalibacter sp.]